MSKKVSHKNSKILVAIIFAIIVLGSILVGLVFFKDKLNLFPSMVGFSDKLGERIYFSVNNKLMSVDVKTKQTATIDEGLSTLVSYYQTGSQYPLNSKYFSKVAYIKNNSVWIYDGTKSEKINQPNIEDKSYSNILLSIWSPKADYLIYYLVDSSNSLNPEIKDSPDLRADNNTLGAYVYSLSSKKSTRLPQVSKIILGWVPGTSQIAYLNPEKDANGSEENGAAWNNVHYYDVKSGTDTNFIKQDYSGGLMRFSDDGSRILYSGADTNDENNLQYLISKPDLKDPLAAVTFPRSQIGFLGQDFIKGSYKHIVYSTKESVACDSPRISDGTGCYAQYLKTTRNQKKSAEVIDWYGFYDYDQAVILTGLDYTSAKKTDKILSLYDIETGQSDQLYKATLPVYEKPLLSIGDSLGLHAVGR